MSTIAGLDQVGQAVISRRLSLVITWLRSYLDPDLSERDLEDPERRVELLAQFCELERRLRQDDSPSWDVRRNARTHWRDTVLFPLAHSLKLVQQVEERAIAECWRKGLFDQLRSHKRQSSRPELPHVLRRVRQVMVQTPYNNHRLKALRTSNICQDDTKAQRVVKELERVPERAAWQARGILLSVLGLGPIGLLSDSTHACIDELFRLERLTTHIARMTDQPQAVLALLRADLIALKKTLSDPALGLWKAHIVYELPGSEERQRFLAQLSPAVREAVVHKLSVHRECSTFDAETLLTTFAEQGLFGMVDWRCAASSEALRMSLRWQRVLGLLDRHISGVVSPLRQEIETLLEHLLEALDETGLAFPVFRLLDEYPSSPYRIRFGRRVWFGVPSIVSRRQRPRTYRGRRRASLRKKNPLPPELVARFVELFASKAGLSLQNARYRLRGLITYGAIGLLNLTARKQAVDKHLIGYLHFIKLGRLEGTVDWSQLLDVLNQFAAEHGLPPVSRQVAKAIFNLLPKPRRWHGGTGRAVARVRQRATLHISGIPRLHEAWAIVMLELEVAGKPFFILLVIDHKSQLPMGAWVSENVPGVDEIGLALYQAIWHTGALDWPLHGLPETIIFPHFAQALDLRHVQRAAALMLAETVFAAADETIGDELVQRIKGQFAAQLSKSFGRQSPEPETLQHALLRWLYAECFPNHRAAEVPAQYRRKGYAMPAWDSVIAALLLPCADGYIAARNAVRCGEFMYSEGGFTLSPGVAIEVRRYPHRHRDMEDSVFVRLIDRNARPAIYLRRTKGRLRVYQHQGVADKYSR